jgi:DNA gyrase/topoisomerase IV subunit A
MGPRRGKRNPSIRDRGLPAYPPGGPSCVQLPERRRPPPRLLGLAQKTSRGYGLLADRLTLSLRNGTRMRFRSTLPRIPRTRADQYRLQKRGGKGVRGASLRGDDVVEHFIATTNHHWLLFFTTAGRVYRTKAYNLPEASRDAKGGHVAGLLSFQPDESIAQVLAIRDYDQAPYLVLATRNGLVKKTRLGDYNSPRQAGVIAINFREDDDELIGAELVSSDDDILLVSRKGQAIRFRADDAQLRPMGRATSGVTGMKFRDTAESTRDITGKQRSCGTVIGHRPLLPMRIGTRAKTRAQFTEDATAHCVLS